MVMWLRRSAWAMGLTGASTAGLLVGLTQGHRVMAEPGAWGGADWAADQKKPMLGLAVKAENLTKLAFKILLAAGSSEEEATIVAENLVESNLKGHDSHGVGYLTRYIPGIQAKLLKVNQHAQVLSDRGPFVLVDGNLGFGQVIGKEATALGIEKCKQHGVAVVGVKNSHHLARIGKFAEMCAAEGFVAVHFTNVAGHDPLVAPFLGTDARLGTNPFTIAFPALASEDGQPILLDYATSELALGKVREYKTAGKALRPGVLLDKHGNPTTDSNCLPPDDGAILPFGSAKSGYKGYGLAMMCELLGGVMTGGYTIEPSHFRSHKTIVNSMTAIIIDPAFLGGSAADLKDEATRLCEYVKKSPARDPKAPVEVPGEMERYYYQLRMEHGIPMSKGSVDTIVGNAVKVGISESEARETLGGKPITLAEDKWTRFSQVM